MHIYYTTFPSKKQEGLQTDFFLFLKRQKRDEILTVRDELKIFTIFSQFVGKYLTFREDYAIIYM